MNKTSRLLALPLLIAIAGCGDKNAGNDSERKTAAGEVLGGTISDDMLPLDAVTSQSPPLRESGDSGNAKPIAETSDAPAKPAGPPAPPSEATDAPADK